MRKPLFFFAALVGLALLVFSFAAAAQQGGAEPSVAEIYQAARAGQTQRANEMVDRVIASHPTSAKAHYVKAELAARDGRAELARQELATAERLAPGLPFVQPASLQQLRAEISGMGAATNRTAQSRTWIGGAPSATMHDTAARGLPWGLLAGGALLVVGVLVMLRRRAAPRREATAEAGASSAGWSPSPESARPMGPVGPVHGPYAYGPGQAVQPPGMGSSIMRGVGTGLAVGAGVVAAEHLGRRIFDHDGTPSAVQPPDLDTHLGGNNFGIIDGGSWDDAGGGDFGGVADGGGDWDN